MIRRGKRDDEGGGGAGIEDGNSVAADTESQFELPIDEKTSTSDEKIKKDMNI